MMFSHCRANTKYEAAFGPASLVQVAQNSSFRLGTVIQFIYWQTLKTVILFFPRNKITK